MKRPGRELRSFQFWIGGPELDSRDPKRFPIPANPLPPIRKGQSAACPVHAARRMDRA